MSEATAIADALTAAGRDRPIRSAEDCSGGCIHRVRRLRLDGGEILVAKINRAGALALFEEEAVSLRALDETRTVLVPRPLHVGVHGDRAILLMNAIEPAPAPDEAAWHDLGRRLADLHGAGAGARYGFPLDNHLGSTPQPNGFSGDWVEFNTDRRLGYQITLAADAGRLAPDEAQRLQRLVARLDTLIPRAPEPALLHGDLWSGNALPTVDATGAPTVAVIDPACSIGDGWADIAMMRLFGGFPPACFEAYGNAVDDHEDVERRVAVYQLYHLLNHLNLFGRGYAGQVMSVVGGLGF